VFVGEHGTGAQAGRADGADRADAAAALEATPDYRVASTAVRDSPDDHIASAGVTGGQDHRAHGREQPDRQRLSRAAAAVDTIGQSGAAPTRGADDTAPWVASTSASRFSDADAIHIGNAGLVLLWPFLAHFFTQLELIADRGFSGPAAMQRAVGLLQHLAAEEAAAPEYLLPLNKVLCGMPLDDVFDFGPPITRIEIDACEDLLSAVIHHAPILRDMSIPGFRQTFLLREGQLGARDGHWLLRVERETFDIVLDRFPWSAGIVKLPWMAAIVQVEW
jgi:hypothetical protein